MDNAPLPKYAHVLVHWVTVESHMKSRGHRWKGRVTDENAEITDEKAEVTPMHVIAHSMCPCMQNYTAKNLSSPAHNPYMKTVWAAAW